MDTIRILQWLATCYIVLVASVDNNISPQVGPEQFCQTEQFTATCEKDEIIVMSSALYGRMNLGRCVLTDYGHVGCQENVLMETDRRCSGRHGCEIRIPDAVFDSTSPCPLEFKTYFEAAYRCFKVASALKPSCDGLSGRSLTAMNGYISNIVTEETDVGDIMCPWVITVLPGQKVNITLYDFFQPTLNPQDVGLCHQYALITERIAAPSNPSRNMRLCGGDQRVRNVFLSKGNTIEVRIVKRGLDMEQYFMLYYEAVGCPLLTSPKFGWVVQDEKHAQLGCNFTDLLWKLQCDGNTWIGERFNCTAAPPERAGMIMWGNISLPYGVSVGIISGLAIIVGVIILLVGLICLEWKKMKRSAVKGEPGIQNVPPGGVYKEGGQYVKQGEMTAGRLSQSMAGPPMGPPGPGQPPLRDNEYAYVREMWPMIAPPNSNVVNHQAYNTGTGPRPQRPTNYGTSPGPRPTPSFTYGASPGKVAPITPESTPSGSVSPGPHDHIYESPKTIRREVEMLAGPHYFELDPHVLPKPQHPTYTGQQPDELSLDNTPRTPDEDNCENQRILGNYSRD